MLQLEENLLLGQLIGIINGLYNDPDIAKLEPTVRTALKALKTGTNYQEARDMVLTEKKAYLLKCMNCKESCGKSDDYFLNSITEAETRETKINDFHKFINYYTDETPYQDALDQIAMLKWW